VASNSPFLSPSPIVTEVGSSFRPIQQPLVFQATGLGPQDVKIESTNFISQYALNGHMHELELCIINESGIYGISPTSIISLNIENTLSNWVVTGDITVFYNAELAEAFNKTNNKNFVFRNDGNDYLRLRLVPLDIPVRGNTIDAKNKAFWELNFLFAIHNVEDVTQQTGGNSQSQILKKYKKFSFWDVRYQKMLTRNIEYSTATSSFNSTANTTSPVPDDDRSLPTDIAIYDIIKKALDNDPLLTKTGYERDPANNWDNGATRLFYTSPAGDSAFDSLMYVFSRHTSRVTDGTSANDFAILEIERGTNDLGYFSLRPLSKYFENAGSGPDTPGKFQIEHFFLQANTQNSNTIGLHRAPISNNYLDRDLKFRDYSNILKYEFVDISPLMNASQFVTTPVFSFDFKNRQYNAEFKNTSIKKTTPSNLNGELTNTVENFIDVKYINQLFRRVNDANSKFLIETNSYEKQNNLSINPVYSLYGDRNTPEIRNPDGFHKLLRTGIFQNTAINFTVPGLTMREPGRFIAIDRPEGTSTGDIASVDDKLCGQWFVINVVHTISNGAYYNNITAVKIHRHQSINFFNNSTSFSDLTKQFKL
jgi:hypothetical protein